MDGFLRGLTGAAPSRDRVRHLIPASEAYLAAVASGLAWGMIPDEQEAQLPPDTLVDLAPGRAVEVPLHWQQWKLDSPALAALTQAVLEAARGLGRGTGAPRTSALAGRAPRRKVST
jgi:LysR family transcriptional regulator (chromosome initiation inhibitor)